MDLMNNMHTLRAKQRRCTQICFVASASLKPWNLKNDSSCFATPIPAEPAPKNRMRCSASGLPEASDARCAAFRKPDSTTAPVP